MTDLSLKWPCGATVLRARGRRLCKTIRPGGEVIAYDAAKIFDLYAVPLANLAALYALLRDLAGRTDCALARGAPVNPERSRGVRRLLHDNAATGDAATLRDAPRCWLALDLDGLPLPAGTDPRDLVACARVVLPSLPAAFHHAAAAVQATATHGITSGARLRLWFWCDRALSGSECKRWLAGAPVDLSIFGGAQVTYTATPIFAAGVADPLPARLALLPGHEVVAAPAASALAPPRRPSLSPALPETARGSRYALVALARAAARVAGAAEGNRHAAAKSAAWGLAGLFRAGLLTEAEVSRTIGSAIAAAGKDPAEGEAIAAWAMAHRLDATPPAGTR